MKKKKIFKWKQEDQKKYNVVIESGNQYFGYGYTKMKLYANGKFEVENRLQEKQISLSGTLPEADKRLEQIFSDEILGCIWNLKYQKRAGIPDESKIIITLFMNDKKMAILKLWEGVAQEQSETRYLLQNCKQILDTHSKGQIIL